jgi:hypothetical protein
MSAELIQMPKRHRSDEIALSQVLFALATGWYPWGHKPVERPTLSLSGGRWIMCCGHVLSAYEVDEAIALRLLESGPHDRFDRPTLILGRDGEAWLSRHWPAPPYLTGREE